MSNLHRPNNQIHIPVIMCVLFHHIYWIFLKKICRYVSGTRLRSMIVICNGFSSNYRYQIEKDWLGRKWQTYEKCINFFVNVGHDSEFHNIIMCALFLRRKRVRFDSDLQMRMNSTKPTCIKGSIWGHMSLDHQPICE